MKTEQLSKLMLLALMCSILLWSQGGGGSISGVVLDPTGAVVPNASVEAANTATGVSLKTNTSRNVLQSTENPILVSLQGSQDHHVPVAEGDRASDVRDPGNWRHLLFASALYDALGIWPSRDNIQTVADPNAYEDLLLGNLLGGSIELGHRIGESDAELVRKTYRDSDGLVLKPDRPITPLDRAFLEDAAVGYTESTISGKRWYYVLSLPPAGYLPEFSAEDLGATGKWAVYDFDRQSISIKEARAPITLERGLKHQYFILAPLEKNGMALVGDVDKFIMMADQRIAALTSSEESLRVEVLGSSRESPVIAGYSAGRPNGAECRAGKIEEFSSLGRLRSARSGWFWDPLSKLWHVKVDFAGSANVETSGSSFAERESRRM